MNNIAEKAKQILNQNQATVVIGYSESKTGKIRPVFITDAEKTDSLIFDERCVQNLAVYLTKHEVKHLGKMAIVANLPVMRSIMMLISERQVKAENLIVIGIDSNNQLLDFEDITVMGNYISKENLANPSKDQELIDKLNAISSEEKFAFWQNEFSKCIRCYACRQSCPMCYCVRCTTECNQPQWIPVEATTSGNMDWHVLRAMHLAGRCISCGECGRACPVDIPCHLLTMYVSQQVNSHFGVWAGTNDKMESVLSTYKPNDKDNFII